MQLAFIIFDLTKLDFLNLIFLKSLKTLKAFIFFNSFVSFPGTTKEKVFILDFNEFESLCN